MSASCQVSWEHRRPASTPRYGFDDRAEIEELSALAAFAHRAKGIPACYVDEAMRLTIETGEAHYFSRTRQAVWHKGATSGLTQTVVRMRIDDDQDALWLEVAVAGSGASCHVGYRSCFYREVPFGSAAGRPLRFTETERRFDPVAVYGDSPNPTIL
jgi:phosphoribosyl-AMP cyclohydrolase